MIYTFSKIYEGASVSRMTMGLIYFRFPVTGVVKTLRLIGNTGSFTGSWMFNLRLNGVAQFSGVNRPKLTPSDVDETKSGLSIAVTQGDKGTIDLEQTGNGTIPGPIVVIVEVEVPDDFESSVSGPGSSTDNAIALFAGTDGDQLQDSAVVISTDETLAADSDSKVPTEKAVKAYVDANSGGGGGGADELADLDDVDLSGVADGDVLAYDSGDSKWKPAAPSGGGGGGDDFGDVSIFKFEDDFVGGGVKAADDAARWRIFTASGSGVVNVDSNSAHPGILRCESGDHNFTGIALNMETVAMPLNSDMMFDMVFVVRASAGSGGLAAIMYRLGLISDPTAAAWTSSTNPNEGIYIEKKEADGADVYAAVRTGFSNSSRTLLHTATNGAWYKYRVRRIDSSTIGFSVNDGTEVTIATANVPSNQQMLLHAGINRPSFTTSPFLYIDYIGIKVTGLTRF